MGVPIMWIGGWSCVVLLGMGCKEGLEMDNRVMGLDHRVNATWSMDSESLSLNPLNQGIRAVKI